MIVRAWRAVRGEPVADGHVIGNHTQTHASLTGRSTGSWHLDDATTVKELAQTDALIAPFVMGQHQAADWDCWSSGNDGVQSMGYAFVRVDEVPEIASVSASGGKPDPCASSPQRNPVN